MNDPHARGNDGRGQVPAPPNSSDGTEDAAFVAEIATGLWRIQRKVQPLGETAGSAEWRTVCRHVESTLDVLASREFEIRDDTSTQYVAGMALKVVAFQPTEGIDQETICETIRPSVYYRGKLVQRGEVVVATPKNVGSPSQGDSPHLDPETDTPEGQPEESAAADAIAPEKDTNNTLPERNE